jgi:hypothetical protein
VVKAAFEKLRREEFEDEVALVAALLEVMSCKDEYYPDEVGSQIRQMDIHCIE